MKLTIYLNEVLIFLSISIFLQTNSIVSSTRTMMVEQINPSEFEASVSIKLTEIPDDFDDGTTGDIKRPKNQNTREGTNGVKLWPNGVIPYLIDSKFTSSERRTIARVISLFHKYSCVKIMVRTTESDYVVIKKDGGTSCSSDVGMRGGRQSVILAERCVATPGSTIHELLHAFGFYHEQERTNRDNYIRVYYKNIIKSLWSEFDKISAPVNNLANYDYLSLMHYTNYADSKNGDATMERKKDKNGKLGQRKSFTRLDLEKLNKAYKCNKFLTKTATSSDEIDEDNEIDLLSTSNITISTSKSTDQNSINPNCFDYDPLYCKEWARLGHCQESQMFMTVFCKKSCTMCHMICVDMRRECGIWASKGYCTKYSDYMKFYCTKSCGACS